MAREIDILVVEPGKAPRPARVTDTLETFSEIVGGPIEAGCYLPQRVLLIYNSEGKRMGLPPNRANPRANRGVPAEPQRSGFGGERKGKGTERSFPLQWETEQSGFCPDVVAGTFFLCGFEGEHFASLTPSQQAEFQDYFAKPGEFMMFGAELVCASRAQAATTACKLWDSMENGQSLVLTKWGGGRA